MKTIEEHIKEILKSRFSPVSNLDVKIDYAVKDILEALEEAIMEEREDAVKKERRAIVHFLDVIENLSRSVLDQIPSEQVRPSRITFAVKDMRDFINKRNIED